MKLVHKNVLFIAGVIVPIILAVYFYNSFFLSDFPLEENIESGPRKPSDFNDADYFVKFGYAEIKDLVKQMISLLTAMLIFSVTFSEKIVNFSSASQYAKVLLIISWTMMIFALIFDGLGLALNALAYPTAIADVWAVSTDPEHSSSYFYEPAMRGLAIIVFSGVCFVLSLVFLVAAGAWSMITK